MIYTYKVTNHAGSTCFRGTLTMCAKWIARTKNTKQYGIKKL